MDFSAFNPQSSNALNLAARRGERRELARLLHERGLDPNLTDNRGWSCLHEAAAHDRAGCVRLLLRHPLVRARAETHEGHTPLYLACRAGASLRTAELLLRGGRRLAQYASNEMVSPLHLAAQQGRADLAQLLLEHSALPDLQDFDGDTPLHDAAFADRHELVALLLHAGAEPELRNRAGYAPFHLACLKGCFNSVKEVLPYVTDIDGRSADGETPLMLATQSGSLEIVEFLLKHGADPNLIHESTTAIYMALIHGYTDILKLLLSVTKVDKIYKEMVHLACKPHYFNMDIIVTLLESDLGPEFFNITEKFHVTLEKVQDIQPQYAVNSPLNSFLHISEYVYNQSPELFRKLFYLFLMRGVPVDALSLDECPPLVFMHYCEHTYCSTEVIETLIQQGCNIDYKSGIELPDIIVASLVTGGHTLPTLLQYSLACEPHLLLLFMVKASLIGRTSTSVQQRICQLIDSSRSLTSCSIDNISSVTPTLKHQCRLKIRELLRDNGVKTTKEFFKALISLPLPNILQSFLRYVW